MFLPAAAPAAPMRALGLTAPEPWAGLRFAIVHEPPAEVTVKGRMLYVHPLAEEMNKSRRMAARQAQRLARAGWQVLIVDRLGCGDSDGGAADMAWDAWRADVRAGLTWLRQQGSGPLWLWGLRAGCLLATEVAAEGGCNGLLLWQPQTSGKLAAQQFLRLRLAADMLGGQAKGAMDALRRSIQAGETVTVAGYSVRAALIDGLEAATLLEPPPGLRVVWLELGAQGAEPAPASQRFIEQWRQRGVSVEARVVAGPMFWQVTEIEDAPALWEATDMALAEAA